MNNLIKIIKVIACGKEKKKKSSKANYSRVAAWEGRIADIPSVPEAGKAKMI